MELRPKPSNRPQPQPPALLSTVFTPAFCPITGMMAGSEGLVDWGAIEQRRQPLVGQPLLHFYSCVAYEQSKAKTMAWLALLSATCCSCLASVAAAQ